MVDVLLIEDNQELSGLIFAFLKRDGYDVAWAGCGQEAMKFLEKQRAKLILLDIMLPDMDGFQICTSIREQDDIPIVIISARAGKEDKMNGFRLGADDYVEKPVDMDILSAKIRALLSRSYERKQKNALLLSGKLAVDKRAQVCYYYGKPIALTVKEYELLLILIENEGKTLTKEYLFNRIWGYESESENQTLTVHIKTLRDKIEENSKSPMRIVTVWGVGYRYEKV